jgi:hypothetical protein
MVGFHCSPLAASTGRKEVSVLLTALDKTIVESILLDTWPPGLHPAYSLRQLTDRLNARLKDAVNIWSCADPSSAWLPHFAD